MTTPTTPTPQSTTFEQLSAILVRDYPLTPDRLTPAATLESLGIDSLGAVELLWSLEEVFKIKLPSEPGELHTLGDVVHFVDGLIARQCLASPSGLRTA